jgi:alanyl-tRNA synthetase
MLKSLNIAIPLEELVLKQIKTLKNSFPELEESIDRIVEIVALEKRRYDETLLKGGRIVKQLAKQSKLKKQKIHIDTLIDLYDTHGQPRALRSIYPKTSILWLRVCTARNRRRRGNPFWTV